MPLLFTFCSVVVAIRDLMLVAEGSCGSMSSIEGKMHSSRQFSETVNNEAINYILLHSSWKVYEVSALVESGLMRS